MKFPLVEAVLLTPKEGEKGHVSICTNTLAPGMVINELPLDSRGNVAVLGSLVVNRDGCERMILNCLAHPTLEYLILFGEETSSFRPSTNLLNALMHGYKKEESGNIIVNGEGVSHQYPNVSEEMLDKFRQRMKVIPLHKHLGNKKVLEEYLEWLKGRVPEEVHAAIQKIRAQKKIYYNSLSEFLSVLDAQEKKVVTATELDAKDFQHLQPPIVQVEGSAQKPTLPFKVTQEGTHIKAQVDFEHKAVEISGVDSFLMAFSLMQFMKEHNLTLEPKAQLYLGAELSRVEVAIRNGIEVPPFIIEDVDTIERESIPLAGATFLKADKEYYYKVALKDGFISIQSMAHDTCASVFELRCKELIPLIDKIAQENRFQSYEQEVLHRLDVGIESARAAIALSTGNSFFQDFRNLFTVNKTNFPLIISEADSFLRNHQSIITKLYTKGMTLQHPDVHKGTMRSACILAIYRRAGNSLEHFPRLYGSASQPVEDMRSAYKEQLLSKENDGAYTYGERTRSHFGMDQLKLVAGRLKTTPTQPAVVQRFDFNKDMTITQTPITNEHGHIVRTRIEATHDPCLTHDIYFIQDNKLHSFHIARAHNIVNAYPENIFGLHDAYDHFIANELNMELGDMFVLSSRGNMLLLTEEQKAKKLIAEPSKPPEDLDIAAGPINLANAHPEQGVSYLESDLMQETQKPNHPCLPVLENYKGQNIINKAAEYLHLKGVGHNNPVIGCYDPASGEISEKTRLIFFQANVRGGHTHATAVFLGGTKEMKNRDITLCNYLATQYANKLELPLGKLFLFYVPTH